MCKQTPYNAKLLRIIFDRVDGYIRQCVRFKYMTISFLWKLLEKFLKNWISYIMLNINISDIYSHRYTKIKTDSDDTLPLKETLNMHNVVILIKSDSIKITPIITTNYF